MAKLVKSFDGLWDEDSEAVCYNLANPKRCFKHDFVNAYVRWSKENFEPFYLSSIKNRGLNDPIRLCRKCLYIDCFHSYEKNEAYEVEGENYYDINVVKTCRICKKRVRIGGCRDFTRHNNPPLNYGISKEE